MRSMTGYGRGACLALGRRVTVEIRTVNHRFFDLKLRSPWVDAALESLVGTRVRGAIERGSVTVVFRDEVPADAAAEVRVNLPLARGYHAALEQLRDAIGSLDPVPLALVAQMPDVITVGESLAGGEALYQAVQPALDGALESLGRMRETEGRALAEDLGRRLAGLAQIRTQLTGHATRAPDEHRKRLEERLGRLLRQGEVDAQRLAQEVALFAERVDVSEELVRLESHFSQFQDLLREGGSVGRKLEFVLQEINREINTIASKLPGSSEGAAAVTPLVVSAKAELEKMREQVQNVE